MKKILFVLISICIITVSCKKEHKVNPVNTGPHKVTFNVGFSSTVTSFETTRLKINSTTPDTALTNHIDVLSYTVFDSLGKAIHQINQVAADTSFGKFVDNLHPGHYTVVVVGGKAGITIPFYQSSVGTPINNSLIVYNPDPVLQNQNFTVDAFYKKIALTVTNTDSNQSINLDRIVSKLIVKINDAIPVGARYIAVTIKSGYGNYFNVGTATAGNNSTLLPAEMTRTLSDTDAGTTNLQFSTLLLYTSPLTVEIFCSSSRPVLGQTYTGTVYGDKIINNVTCEPNKVTILSGNLFGGSGGGVTVSADTTWHTPVTRGF